MIMLDTGPLSRACDPARNQEIADWLKKLLDSDITLYIPEIADYEARRGMLAKNMTRAVKILDQLKANLNYVPLSTSIMLRAAELWAEARKRGKPTADEKELDGDVILVLRLESFKYCHFEAEGREICFKSRSLTSFGMTHAYT